MNKELIKQNVGIDVAKDSFHAVFSVKYSDGSIVLKGSRNFTNDVKGTKEFIEWSSKKSVKEVDASFTMEATGVYYENLAYYLLEEGNRVHVVLPNMAKKYHQSLGLKSKTDKIDAQVLGQMGLERSLQLWQPLSTNFRILKQLIRERDAIVCDRTASLSRLHAYSHQGKPLEASVMRSKKQIAFFETEIKEIEKEIHQLVDSDEALKQRLAFVESIKGVGFLTAITVVAETNGFAAINNLKQLTSYAGLDVKIAESGKWKGKSKISKQGNRFIRKSLYMPALTKIQRHPQTHEYYERLVGRKGVKMVAATAVQRKLLGLIYTLWKKQEMFEAKT